MRKIFNYAIIAASLGLGLWSSCAKSVDVDTDERNNDVLREWVSLNRPDLTEVYEGFFMRVYTDESNDVVTDSIEYRDADWFELTYSAQTLDGNYYYNMDKALSDTLGYFAFSNRYVPNRYSYTTYGGYLTYAQTLALPYMYPLDSVEIIASSSYVCSGELIDGYIAYGYGGSASLSGSSPAHIKMKFNRLITDMYSDYRTEVRDYAVNELGLAAEDSIKGVSLLYMKKLVENPLGDTVYADTAVYVKYTGMFTDGFVFDTNDEDVAIANNIYSASNSYDDFEVTYSSTEESSDYSDDYSSYSDYSTTTTSTTGVITGFRETVINMRKGEKAIAVFTPNIGYGSAGNMSSSMNTKGFTLIRPNEPLVFIIEVLEDDDDE